METNDNRPQKKVREPIPQSVRFNVLRRDNFSCRYCGTVSGDGVTLHIDHAISVRDGGTNDESNLITACSDCNYGKGAKSLKKLPSTSAKLEKQEERTSGLVGMWGHTFTEHHCLPGKKQIQWQFKIIRWATPEFYICQLFSWLDGEPTNCESIATKTLLGECTLYDTNEQMLAAYEKECRQHNEEIRRAGGYTKLRSSFG